MLIINFKNNIPQQNHYNFSVVGNNKSNKIKFILDKYQDEVDLSEFSAYVKVMADGGDFVDLIPLSHSVVGSEIEIVWELKRKTTQFSIVECQLSFKKTANDDSVVWQSAIFGIELLKTIKAEEEISDKYPTILEEQEAELENHEERIEALEEGGGGGVSKSLGNVEIEKIWLTYDDRKSIQTDYLGLEEDGRFVNDSTRIWVNFKTTPISSGIEKEINKGRFIIRLDYPSKSRNQHIEAGKGGLIKYHQPQADYGVGARSFCHSFIRKDTAGEKSRIKTSLLKSSMIYIEPNDVKTNRYGEKYIHKKISFFEYINKTCVFRDSETFKILYPLTLDNIKEGNEFDEFFANELVGAFSIGIPALNQNGVEGQPVFSGTFVYKCYNNREGDVPNIANTPINGKKINPAFSCYSPLVIKDFDYSADLSLYSPFWNNHIEMTYTRKVSDYGVSSYYTMFASTRLLSHNMSKRNFMVAKPRCAILSDNYETNDYAFLKTFPQADQQIKLVCKAIRDVEEYGVMLMPIFRIKITAK